MRHTITVIFIFLLSNYDAQFDTLVTEDYIAIYDFKENRVDGHYISYYKNGIKKSEGKYRDNYRIEDWRLYDSLGNLKTVRNYTFPFEFERIYPEYPNDEQVAFLLDTETIRDRNINGFYDYTHLKEKDVLWSIRIWRTIENDRSNKDMYRKASLEKLIKGSVIEKGIKLYDISSLSSNEINATEIDFKNLKLKKLLIVEDSFFDKSRLVYESRIVWLVPVFENTKTREEVSMFKIYFPEFRHKLVWSLVKIKNKPHITNMDDMFFFRNFSSSIYKESNIHDKINKKPTVELEIAYIEKYNDFLIGLIK
jgi:antitoxin component YwqK of YwqJK toxin-antitoxin module